MGTPKIVTRSAINARYDASAKGRARRARYLNSAKGRATKARLNAGHNQRRIYIGDRYIGEAETRDQSSAINAHAKERLRGFKQGQSARAQAESVSSGPIPTQTEP